MDKKRALAGLERDIRRSLPGDGLVMGNGPPGARLMLIGEAPGKEEEAAGRPFVGRAGRLLDRLLAEESLRREDIWITNVMKWRPTEGERLRTRSPRVSEVGRSKDWLLREIEIIRPGVIVCLGNVAARAVIGSRFKMTAGHGEWRQGPFGIPTMATFHPAYAGRFGSQALAVLRDDLRKAVARLRGLPSRPDHSG